MAVLCPRTRLYNLLKMMESSFSTLRRMPGPADLSTKAGPPKKPIRYTSIKKAKPKTITDIGDLLLQKARNAKDAQELINGEVALSNSLAVAGPVPAKSLAGKKPNIKAVPEQSVISTSIFNAPLNKFDDSLCEISTPGKNVGETVPEPSFNLCTKASATSNPSPPVSTSFNVTLQDKTGASHVSNSVLEEMTSTHHAISESGPALSAETYFESHTIDTVDLSTGKDFVLSIEPSPDLSPLLNSSTEPAPLNGDTESIHASKGGIHNISEVNDIMPMQEGALGGNVDGPNSNEICVSLTTPELKSSQTQGFAPTLSSSGEMNISTRSTVQGLGSLQSPMTSNISPSTTCSLQNPEEEARCQKLSLQAKSGYKETAYRLPFPEPNVPPVSPNKDFASQVVAAEEVVVFVLQPKTMDASTEKGPDVTLDTVVSLMRSNPAYAESSEEDGLKTKGEHGVQEFSDVQLDPIQKLFLDKIREFSAKSKDCDGLLDAGPEYEKAFLEELTKLQRQYGNGDLSSFPEFKFSEPVWDDIDIK